MNLGKLVLSVTLSELERLIESLLVSFEIDSGFNKTILDQELGTLLSSHILSNFNCDFTEFLLGAICLCDSESFLPQVTCSVHIDSVRPCATFDVVVLGLLKVVLHLKLLGKVVMSVLEQVHTELHDQADHLVIHLGLLVHVDGEIGLISRQVHPFGLLVVTFTFELSGFGYLDDGVLRLRQVASNNLVGLIPLVGTDIHFKSFNEFLGLNEIFLGKVHLSNFGVVTSDLLEVGSGNLGLLVRDELNSTVPLSGREGSLNSFVEDTSLNEVLNREVKLLLGSEPVTPLFFKGNNVGWESSFSELDSLSKSVALHI